MEYPSLSVTSQIFENSHSATQVKTAPGFLRTVLAENVQSIGFSKIPWTSFGPIWQLLTHWTLIIISPSERWIVFLSDFSFVLKKTQAKQGPWQQFFLLEGKNGLDLKTRGINFRLGELC